MGTWWRFSVYVFVLFYVSLRCASRRKNGKGTASVAFPLKKQVFFSPPFWFISPRLPRRIISAFASADFAVACIFMGRCDLRTNIPMQTDSSRFHGCEGCEVHANKLVSLMSPMDIFRIVLFSLVQIYGSLKSSDWPFFCLSSPN